jgi:hypothetical protein
MEERITYHLGTAAAGVVDVISFHGDHVVLAVEENGPVMVVIACCAPGCGAVEFGVGDCDVVGCTGSGDEHLAADEGDFTVVDPDEITSCESDGIASPDVLGIEICDVDVSWVG